MNLRLLVVTVVWLAVVPAARAAEGKPRYADRWVYVMTNLQVEKQADDLVRLIDRAAGAGYNGIVLADYKLNILDRVPSHYFRHLERVMKAAAAAKVEIIPAVFPIGYSSGVLAHDPNLAEGLEVADAPFVIQGSKGRLLRSRDPLLRNGGLEEVKANRFTGFSYQDDPGKTTFADRDVVRSGKVSCRMESFRAGTNPNTRLVQRVKVRPRTCYRLSAWVKTRELQPSGNFKLLALGAKGRTLSFQEGELKPTQDWTHLDIVFNSLDESEVNLYAGIWSGRSGTVWVDELKLEELALVNVLRRPGCPLVVKSADGTKTYEEGKDFEPVRDAKLGRTPWAGEYAFAHAGAELRLKLGSRIREGEKLLVSWYHPVKTHSYQVMCCLSEPALYEVLERQARLVQKHLRPRTWFLSHDEIRVAGWCRACRQDGKTPGELLAANVRHCVEIVRKLDAKARLVVWSDMFDPHHNAVGRYYLVNGTLKGSWEGLAKDVQIANWNGGKAGPSLRWFAGRGHEQIVAGFYDGDESNFHRWNEAARGVPGVRGFLYTTWRHDYSKLEAFGKLMRGK